MLAEILCHLNNHHSVSLTCKRFYEISCDTKFFRLIIRSNEKGNFEENLCKTVELMMKSERRFNEIEVLADNFDSLKSIHIDYLTKVIETFGNDIKKLSISLMELPLNFIDWLNLMPKLESIHMNGLKIKEKSELEIILSKLKSIYLFRCPENVIELFESLTPGVLEKIQIYRVPFLYNATQELLGSQTNLKEISTDTKIIDRIKVQKMKLKFLELFGSETFNLDGVVNGQNEIETLQVYAAIFPTNLKLICDDLKSLKHIKICASKVPSHEFAEVLRLCCLKKAEISWESWESSELTTPNESLVIMKSNNLTDLTITCSEKKLTTSTFAELGKNCPRLKSLKISSFQLSLDDFGLILQSFSSLEMLNVIVTFTNHSPQANLIHNHLKELIVRRPESDTVNLECSNLLKLTACCKILEFLDVDFSLSDQTLQKLLVSSRKLKILVFNTLKVTRSLISTIKTFGNNLNKFTCNACDIEEGMTLRIIEQELKDHFTPVKQREPFKFAGDNFFLMYERKIGKI